MENKHRSLVNGFMSWWGKIAGHEEARKFKQLTKEAEKQLLDAFSQARTSLEKVESMESFKQAEASGKSMEIALKNYMAAAEAQQTSQAMQLRQRSFRASAITTLVLASGITLLLYQLRGGEVEVAKAKVRDAVQHHFEAIADESRGLNKDEDVELRNAVAQVKCEVERLQSASDKIMEQNVDEDNTALVDMVALQLEQATLERKRAVLSSAIAMGLLVSIGVGYISSIMFGNK
eukprot:m.138677 g.138677  ORF g.138677 m.138677 type:complete len:234 (-) comp16184_c0_seq1:72-773(-)